MESQPKNHEFRNNPENIHPCQFSIWRLTPWKVGLKILYTGIIPIPFTNDDLDIISPVF